MPIFSGRQRFAARCRYALAPRHSSGQYHGHLGLSARLLLFHASRRCLNKITGHHVKFYWRIRYFHAYGQVINVAEKYRLAAMAQTITASTFILQIGSLVGRYCLVFHDER